MNPDNSSTQNDVKRNLLHILNITGLSWGLNPTNATVKRQTSRLSGRKPFYTLLWAW